jgi:fructose transport system permease protein
VDDARSPVSTTKEPEPHGFEERHAESPLQRLQHVLHARPILGPLAVLLLAIIAFSFVSDRFLTAANLGLVMQQVTVIAVLALGQTLVILTAGIDLSVGAIAVFSSIIMANLATDLGMPGVPALLAGIICGTAMGAFNGFLVTRIALPPFIVTLGAARPSVARTCRRS